MPKMHPKTPHAARASQHFEVPCGHGSAPATSQTHKFRWPIHSSLLHSVSTPQTKYLGFVVHESWKLKCICYWTTSQQSPCSQTETSKTGCRSSRKTSLSHTLPWLNLLKLKKKKFALSLGFFLISIYRQKNSYTF